MRKMSVIVLVEQNASMVKKRDILIPVEKNLAEKKIHPAENFFLGRRRDHRKKFSPPHRWTMDTLYFSQNLPEPLSRESVINSLMMEF
jgi:hypothetical protein